MTTRSPYANYDLLIAVGACVIIKLIFIMVCASDNAVLHDYLLLRLIAFTEQTIKHYVACNLWDDALRILL